MRLRKQLAIMLISSVLALCGLVLFTTQHASAHAAYDTSTPAANSVVKTAPTQVSITFVQNLDPQGEAVTIYDNRGKVVSIGIAQISSSNPKTLTIAMQADGSDIYRVDWQTVSAVDGDPTLGAFVFGVDPSGKLDKVPQLTTASPATNSSNNVSPLLTIVLSIFGVIFGFGAALVMFKQQNAKPVR